MLNGMRVRVQDGGLYDGRIGTIVSHRPELDGRTSALVQLDGTAFRLRFDVAELGVA